MPIKPGPLWGKHLAESPDEALVRFCAGRDVRPLPMADAELLPFDLWTNRAHAIMLERQGIVDRPTLAAMLEGLAQLEADWEAGVFELNPAKEDVHLNVETWLTEHKGPDIGGRIHTGRSRNDQVATDMRLFLRSACLEWGESLGSLIASLLDQGQAHAATVMPGFTHMQPAMITTWGHWLCAHVQALCRDLERLRLAYDLCNRSPLGSGAAFGTSWPIDRELTAELLAFERVEINTLDAIGARWECEWQVAQALAAAMTHLAVISQDLILLSHPYWGMIRLNDRHVSGSSIMPQKRNLDFAEIVRGKAAWAGGVASGLLGLAKGAMSGYNRDSQLGKYAALDLVRECREAPVVIRAVLDGLSIDAEKMRELLGQGYLAAADFADAIARKLGLPFRAAYDIAALAVRYSGSAGAIGEAAARQALRESGQDPSLVGQILGELGDPSRVVGWRQHTGAPSLAAMVKQIESLRDEAQRLCAFIPQERARMESAWRRCRDHK